MSQILNKVRDVDANNNEAIKDALSVFFQNLSKHTESSCRPWINTLESVINRFPKFCMTHRATIEIYLTHFLDANNYFHVIGAARCGHALQQVRPTQEKTATPKSNWREQMELLCNAAHSLVDAMFSNTVDIYKNGLYQRQESNVVSTSPLAVALSTINEVKSVQNQYSNEDKTQILSLRLRNVLVFIQAMLVEKYPVAKPVRPQLVLDLIVRASTASSSANMAAVRDSDVSMVKAEVLRCLDALVLCLGPNLVPFSPLVFRVVMQALRWTADATNEEYRKVRCQAYSTLTVWLSCLGCHKPESAIRDARAKSLEDELVANVMRDITPKRHVVQLTMSSQSTKKMSKKAKRKLANTMLQDSAISGHIPGEKNKLSSVEETNEETVLSALQCAETFLTVCGLFLKPASLKTLSTELVRVCNGGASGAVLVSALSALESGRRAAPAALAAPAARLYARGLAHSHHQVSNFCWRALQNIKLHLHCSPPSLNFVTEAPLDGATEEREAKKTISDRNRAALESLLGDRMPQNIGDQDEVITIPDEPSSKKPRIYEEDQISISSQSSVEINEDPEIQENDDDEILEIVNETNEIVKDTVRNYKTVDGNAVKKINNSVINVHEASTQMPNVSGDTIDGRDSPRSEVTYDFPNTAVSQVPILEKMEDENLPSTNDTDDVQITCGQTLKSSQDPNSQKKEREEIKVNGFSDKISEEELVNGDDIITVVENTVTVKITGTDDQASIENMLADFVDEVNEETANV